MSDPIEIRSHGAYNVKGIGRVHLIRTDELPPGRKIVMGDTVVLKGTRMRVRGIDLPRTTENVMGLILEDSDADSA